MNGRQPQTFFMKAISDPANFQSHITALERLAQSPGAFIRIGLPSAVIAKPNLRLIAESAADKAVNRLDPNASSFHNEPAETLDTFRTHRFSAFAPLSGDAAALFLLTADDTAAGMVLDNITNFDVPDEDKLEYTKDALAEFTNELLGNLLDTVGLTRYSIACPIAIETAGAELEIEHGNWIVKRLGSPDVQLDIAVSLK